MESDTESNPGSRGAAEIDWTLVKRRLEKAHAALAEIGAPTPGEVQRILKERAEALAGENDAVETVAEQIEVVEFALAREQYAVESRFVRDVFSLEQLTPLPCTPPFVLGIVNLRGQFLSVIDIKKFFDLPEKGLSDLSKVIVLESGDMHFGVLADAIVGVNQIAVDEIQPSLPTLTGIRAEYLLGITAGRTVVLDAGKLLADETIVVQDQVAG